MIHQIEKTALTTNITSKVSKAAYDGIFIYIEAEWSIYVSQ